MVAHISHKIEYIVPELLLECLDASVQSAFYGRLEDLGNHLLVIYADAGEQRYQVREVGPQRPWSRLSLALQHAPASMSPRYVVRCLGAPVTVVPPGISPATFLPYALSRPALLSDAPAEDTQHEPVEGGRGAASSRSAGDAGFPGRAAPAMTPAGRDVPPVSKRIDGASPIKPPVPVALKLPSVAPVADKPAPAAAEAPAPVPEVRADASTCPTADVGSAAQAVSGSEDAAATTQLRQGIRDFRKAVEARENDLRSRENALAERDKSLAERESAVLRRENAVSESERRQAQSLELIRSGRAELEDRARELSERQERLNEKEAMTNAASAELEKGRVELNTRRDELEKVRVELDARRVELETVAGDISKRQIEQESAAKNLVEREADHAARVREVEARLSRCVSDEAALRRRETEQSVVERALKARNEALEKEIAGLLALMQEFTGETVG